MIKTMKIYICLFMLGLSLNLFSQSKHEFSLWGSGGLSTRKYDVSVGDVKQKFGGSVGIGYNYFLVEQVGIGTGLEFSFYNTRAEFGGIYNIYQTKDYENNNFEFRSKVDNYSENQNALFLNIPLTVQYQTKGHHKFYASTGFKIGIPLSAKYKISGTTIKNSGYYPYENVEYTTQKFMGFGTFENKNIKEDIKLKVSYIFSLETGMKWNLKNNFSLYTGAYFDYGLNNINKNEDVENIVTYNAADPQNFIVNSVLTSQYMENFERKTFTNKVHLMAIGLKVKLAFALKE